MHDQVMIIFAGSQGFLDDVPVEEVKRFEIGVHRVEALRSPAERRRCQAIKDTECRSTDELERQR